MKYSFPIIIFIILIVLLSSGCLTNINEDDNSDKFLGYAEYYIEVNTTENYYLKVPFLSLPEIDIDVLLNEIELLEGQSTYSIEEINASEIPYINVTLLMNKNQLPEDYPIFYRNDMCLVLQGVGITKLNLKIVGEYFGFMTLKNDIDTDTHWVFSLNDNNKNLSITIKASIRTKNSGDFWNKKSSNFLILNGWQTIKIRSDWWIS